MVADDKSYDESNKVACLMLATISSELQNSIKNVGAYDINY